MTPTTSTRSRIPPWARWLGAALLGAVTMAAFGQLFSLAGAGCTILCRPPLAALYGAALGLLVFASARRG